MSEDTVTPASLSRRDIIKHFADRRAKYGGWILGGAALDAKAPMSTAKGLPGWEDHAAGGHLDKGLRAYEVGEAAASYFPGSMFAPDGGFVVGFDLDACEDAAQFDRAVDTIEAMPGHLHTARRLDGSPKAHVLVAMGKAAGNQSLNGDMWFEGRQVGKFRSIHLKTGSMSGFRAYPGELEAVLPAYQHLLEEGGERSTLADIGAFFKAKPKPARKRSVVGVEEGDDLERLCGKLRASPSGSQHDTLLKVLLAALPANIKLEPVHDVWMELKKDEAGADDEFQKALAWARERCALVLYDTQLKLAKGFVEEEGADHWLHRPKPRDEWLHFVDGRWTRGYSFALHNDVVEFNATHFGAWKKNILGDVVLALDEIEGGTTRVQSAVLKQLEDRMSSGVQEFDADAEWIGIPEGKVMSLATGEVRDAVVTDLVTKSLGVIPEADEAKRKEWLGFLRDTWFPNGDEREYALTLIAHALSGREPPHQAALWLYGPKNSGKSLFLGLMRAVFGSYAIGVPYDVIFETTATATAYKVDSHMARMDGARLVCVGDPPGRKKLEVREGEYKSLVGEDILEGRAGNVMVTFRRRFLLALGINELPPLSAAVARRTSPVTFPFSLERDRQDRAMQEKTFARFGGVILYDLLCRMKDELPSLPDSTKDLAAADDEGDQITRFLEDCTAPDPNATATMELLVSAYDRWWESVKRNKEFAKEGKLSAKAIGKRLPSQPGIWRLKNRVMVDGRKHTVYQGVRVLCEEEPAAAPAPKSNGYDERNPPPVANPADPFAKYVDRTPDNPHGDDIPF